MSDPHLDPSDDPDQGEAELVAAYRAGDGVRCAIAHHNFASDLAAADAPQAVIVVHLVASALLLLRLESPVLSQVATNLGRCSLDGPPPSEDDLRQIAESTDGVEFAALWRRLPGEAAPLAEAIAEVWKLARERQRQATPSAPLPESIQAALATGDRSELLAALEDLPPREIEQVMSHLHARGIIDDSALAVMQTLRALAALVRYVALLAVDPDRDRAPVEQVLADMENSGWKIRSAVHRLWNGERDARLLTAGLPTHEAALVRRMVDLILKQEAE